MLTARIAISSFRTSRHTGFEEFVVTFDEPIPVEQQVRIVMEGGYSSRSNYGKNSSLSHIRRK
ncbi:MAG: hypothetical protein AAF298_09855 [Cyanobacteria bacterium P01_A01_bin.40]